MIRNSVRVVTGAQWGDEGKGKVTHFMSEGADIVARFAGGCNAGHTIIFNGSTYKLHHIPSGIFSPQCLNILGNGMVIDPIILADEITSIEKSGYNCSNLLISDRAHIIMPYHRYIDGRNESRKDNVKLGTTGRGIGPAYMDKAARTGIRACDLLDKEVLYDKIKFHLKEKERLLQGSELTAEAIFEKITESTQKITARIKETSKIIYESFKAEKNILLEGAQGALLDIDFGTYPFVTSSSSISGGAAQGSGLPPWSIGRVVGIVKAYTTRIGTGPFPTELQDETGKILLDKGMEYGTTTGRPRRCGWLDLPLLAFSARLNGLTSIALTKLDILTALKKIKVAVGYEYKGKELENFPAESRILEQCTPLYKEFDGWEEDISSVREKSKLPVNAQKYISFIEEYLETPVSLISVGGDHAQTIIAQKEEILF